MEKNIPVTGDFIAGCVKSLTFQVKISRLILHMDGTIVMKINSPGINGEE